MTCSCRKAVFTCRNEAVDIAQRTGGGQRPYVCPFDPGIWHLSTMNPRERRNYRRRLRALRR